MLKAVNAWEELIVAQLLEFFDWHTHWYRSGGIPDYAEGGTRASEDSKQHPERSAAKQLAFSTPRFREVAGLLELTLITGLRERADLSG